MDWFTWAILGSVLVALYLAGTKKILDDRSQNPYLCSVAYRLVAVICAWLAILFFGIDTSIVLDLELVLVFAVGTVLFTIGNMLVYKSFQLIDVSDMSLIGATQPFFVFMFGAAFFGEFLTWQKVVAVGLCFLGIASIYWRGKKLVLLLGHKLTLAGTICFALGSFSDKYLATRLDPLFYVAMGMTATMVTIFLSARLKVGQVYNFLYSKQGPFVILLALIMLAGTVCLMQAYALGAEASKVSLTLYLNTILVVIIGMLFFREYERALQKILATVLIFGGLFLIY